MSETQNLDALEQLASAATPGPWEWWTSNSHVRLTGAECDGGRHGQDGGVLHAANIRGEYATVVVSAADRQFIAAARTAVPELLARVRDAETDAERFRSILAAVVDELQREDRDYNGNAPGHAHETPGVWDGDNGALAGKQCAWCRTWKLARESIANGNL